MTDEEIICTFMEPLVGDIHYLEGIFRSKLDLDALHEVEARLTDSQWMKYRDLALFWIDDRMQGHEKPMLHASAEQKIKALAAVLRNSEPRS